MSTRPARALATILTLGAALAAVTATAAPAAAGADELPGFALTLEAGPVWTGRNDARIPGDTGTLISLDDELESDTETAWRLRLEVAVGDRSTISALYAPLSIDVAGSFDREVRFDDALFPAGAELTGEYRFDSYRLTYRYDDWVTGRVRFGYGFTAKLRDAEISLAGADRAASKTDTGFVPLLHFRLRWQAAARTSLLIVGDALAAPQGRAEDVLVALAHRPAPPLEMYAGYRVLEGGADNDEVYTFALLHYAVAGVTLAF